MPARTPHTKDEAILNIPALSESTGNKAVIHAQPQMQNKNLLFCLVFKFEGHLMQQ